MVLLHACKDRSILMHGEIFHTSNDWPEHLIEDDIAARPIGPEVQCISEGNTMNDIDRGILVMAIRYFIVAIAGTYGITKLEDETTAGAIAAGIGVLIYIALGVFEKLKVKREIEKVDKKAETAATTTEGLPS